MHYVLAQNFRGIQLRPQVIDFLETDEITAVTPGFVAFCENKFVVPDSAQASLPEKVVDYQKSSALFDRLIDRGVNYVDHQKSRKDTFRISQMRLEKPIVKPGSWFRDDLTKELQSGSQSTFIYLKEAFSSIIGGSLLDFPGPRSRNNFYALLGALLLYRRDLSAAITANLPKFEGDSLEAGAAIYRKTFLRRLRLSLDEDERIRINHLGHTAFFKNGATFSNEKYPGQMTSHKWHIEDPLIDDPVDHVVIKVSASSLSAIRELGWDHDGNPPYRFVPLEGLAQLAGVELFRFES